VNEEGGKKAPSMLGGAWLNIVFLSVFRESVLAGAADWTAPVIGQILEGGSGFDSMVRIAFRRVIDVAAWAFPFPHLPPPFSPKNYS